MKVHGAKLLSATNGEPSYKFESCLEAGVRLLKPKAAEQPQAVELGDRAPGLPAGSHPAAFGPQSKPSAPCGIQSWPLLPGRLLQGNVSAGMPVFSQPNGAAQLVPDGAQVTAMTTGHSVTRGALARNEALHSSPCSDHCGRGTCLQTFRAGWHPPIFHTHCDLFTSRSADQALSLAKAEAHNQ